MAIIIENENFGYSVSNWGDYAAIGNPDLLLYSDHSSSYHTGSVLIYKYNNQNDTHEHISTLYAPAMHDEWILAAETGSVVSASLRTENSDLSPILRTKNKDILIDVGDYLTREDDAYGHSVDIWGNLLAVGCKYYHQTVNIGNISASTSGSVVDIYNLSKLNPHPYTPTQVVVGYNPITVGGDYYESASIPPNYDLVSVLFSSDITLPYDEWNVIDYFTPPLGGGEVYYSYPVSAPLGFLAYKCGFSANPIWESIPNPDPTITHSFGHKVAINENWLAISSIHDDNSKGIVYLYNKIINNNFASSSANHLSWSYYQSLQPTDLVPNDQFGYDIDLNKETGSYSGSILIGTNRISESKAYLYEFNTSSLLWQLTHIFNPETGSNFLTFYGSQPVYSSSNSNPEDSYGRSVSLWGNVFVIGAPTDRYIYEYSASSLYHQGAAYIYERCPDPSDGFRLMLKTYGDDKILKNNKLGFSSDVYGTKVIIGAPRYNDLTSCYIQGSYTDDSTFLEDEYSINGQIVYLQKNTSSLEWEIVNTYQTKKRYLEPYTKYGYDVSIHDKFIVVGSPMILSDTNRIIDLSETSSFEPISGRAYIYNFNNFRNRFYVGNVFYRNGVLVVNTSGSAFENLFLDERTLNYQYSLDYKSKQTMYEMQIICQIEPGEFNTSTNPTSITGSPIQFDLNHNGKFDFQDMDVLLKYMQYQNTRFSTSITNNWSQSLNLDDGEISFYQWSADQWKNTSNLFSSSYDYIDANLKNDLDFNQDSKIDINDMNILWKYFSKRLNQKNYNNYITSISERRSYADVSDVLDDKTGKLLPLQIKPEFFNYESNIKNDPTGSYLSPFVTGIGLYDNLDLIGIAKLANPIKLTPDFPYTFVVKMDF